MRKIVTFSLDQEVRERRQTPLNFKKTEGGFTVPMMLFSTGNNSRDNNRNDAHFQVAKLLRWENKLSSLLFNFDHDLSLTGGKYLGNRNKYTSMYPKFEHGELEIWADFMSNDPEVLDRMNEITGPSIELMVDTNTIIENEHGSYFLDFDFVGTALLLGKVAGMGGTRLGEIKEFSLDLQPLEKPTNTDMSSEELKQIMSEFKASILEGVNLQLASFKEESQKEEPKQEETKPEVAPTEATVAPVEELPKAEVKPAEGPVEGIKQPEAEPVQPPQDFTPPADVEKELLKIENSLKEMQAWSEKMKANATLESVSDQNDAAKTAKAPAQVFSISSLAREGINKVNHK